MDIAAIFLAAAAGVAPADTAPPADTIALIEANERYIDCITLVDADIEAGRAAAQQWAGGGADAQHCLALADIAAGFPKLGAVRLEDIAQRKDAGDDYVRARLLAQAAYTWLQAGEAEAAQRAINEAFLLVPDSGELHVTAAKIHAAQKEWHQVVSSVTTAEQAGFASAENYVLRGRAYAELGAYETAAQDVVNALSLNPVNVDALVLRGELQQTGIVIEVYYGADDSAGGDKE
jgi:tetratricopeptide (TPR) repeat protein